MVQQFLWTGDDANPPGLRRLRLGRRPSKHEVHNGYLKLQTVLGTNNAADAMTRAVDRWALDKHVAAMSCTLVHLSLNGLAHLHERSRLHLDRGEV